MQIRSLRVKAYRSWTVDDTTPAEAADRLRRLDLVLKLKSEGCSEATALDAVGWSRATFYRWQKRFDESGLKALVARSRCPRRRRTPQWTRHHEQRVWQLRRRFPAWGKLPIQRVLARDHGIELSVSAVGRILKQGVRLGRVQPVAFVLGRLKPVKHRCFKRHAQRWRYGMKAVVPGELIQIDHMTVRWTERLEIKEFKALCPVSKQMVARVFSSASAHNARRFLDTLRQTLPFPIRSIQVDGGSEFMAEFEDACRELGIPLFVLPPRRPQYNGCVERANATTRYEFYPQYNGPLTVEAVNRQLIEYLQFYNGYRPHQSLDLMTPNEYLARLRSPT
jgi:transposase InsO family protein